MLTRLIYASTKTEYWNDQELEQLIAQAQVRNDREFITGILVFNRKYFMQCIEGDRASVSNLYARILHDKRHQNIQLIAFDEIDGREIEQWTMSYIPDRHITRELVLKYSGGTDFNPYDMTANGALGFIRHLVQLPL